MAYARFTDLPVWRAARDYKRAVYELCRNGKLASNREPREQLRRAAARPPALIAEAYGRFNPRDAARILVQAKAELLETQAHLIDAFDQQFITDAVRFDYHKMAQGVIDQIDGWRDYLQSSAAQRNVQQIRHRRERQRRRAHRDAPEPNAQEPDDEDTAGSQHEEEDAGGD